MPASNATIDSHPAARHWVCWLFVAALLVRTFWLPYHLATEPHYHPLMAALAGAGHSTAANEADPGVVIASSEESGAHSALDHSHPAHPRPGDEEERLGDPLGMLPVQRQPAPSPGLFAGWLDPTQAAPPPAVPPIAAAAPRAPPIA